MHHQPAEQTHTMPDDASVNQSKPVNDFDAQIQREWLLTNGRGGYSSCSVPGVCTRRYHGLLIAAARPPLERWLMVSQLLERVGVAGEFTELATYEFQHAVHPQGYRYLDSFTYSNDPQQPWARWEYKLKEARLVKVLYLARDREELQIDYELTASAEVPIALNLAPMLAMRDFHALTHAFDGSYPQNYSEGWLGVDAFETGPRVWLSAETVNEVGYPASFEQQPHWWHGFVHRIDTARGQEDREDLFVPGWFRVYGEGRLQVRFRAGADFTSDFSNRPTAPVVDEWMATQKPLPTDTQARLVQAASAFVVRRQCPNGRFLTTILAGYPWFGDWGRDTFIALPGLLLETEQFPQAREVLEVFASAQQDGLIPNRFSDYGSGRDYNSVDASLWYIHAADAYVQASGDEAFWEEHLRPACQRVIDAFLAGTRFNIHADEDGLVSCGDQSTQLTWMDAKCGDVVFTPRHGKPVEINALWYHALRIMAQRLTTSDPAAAEQLNTLADKVRASFCSTFWNERGGYLFDVVRDNWKDPAVRPNQIFAVSLPHSPLEAQQQASVLKVVEGRLVTPFGLRSLCPRHPSYAGIYLGDGFKRDSVYHQGTVWGWLMGPYVEAHLRVHDFDPSAKKRMRQRLEALINHLDNAGLGSVSEIFDGDTPHEPRGCPAQAWSVSELLRAYRMTEA